MFSIGVMGFLKYIFFFFPQGEILIHNFLSSNSLFLTLSILLLRKSSASEIVSPIGQYQQAKQI